MNENNLTHLTRPTRPTRPTCNTRNTRPTRNSCPARPTRPTHPACPHTPTCSHNHTLANTTHTTSTSWAPNVHILALYLNSCVITPGNNLRHFGFGLGVAQLQAPSPASVA